MTSPRERRDALEKRHTESLSTLILRAERAEARVAELEAALAACGRAGCPSAAASASPSVSKEASTTCSVCGGPLPEDGGYGNAQNLSERCCSKGCVMSVVRKQRAAQTPSDAKCACVFPLLGVQVAHACPVHGPAPSEGTLTPAKLPRDIATGRRQEVLNRLCNMMDQAWKAIDPNANEPCDCACTDHGIAYANSGAALDFMQRAIAAAINGLHRKDAPPTDQGLPSEITEAAAAEDTARTYVPRGQGEAEGWVRIGRYDGARRRALWLRCVGLDGLTTKCDAIELCAGREGDDASVRIDRAHPGFDDLLDCLLRASDHIPARWLDATEETWRKSDSVAAGALPVDYPMPSVEEAKLLRRIAARVDGLDRRGNGLDTHDPTQAELLKALYAWRTFLAAQPSDSPKPEVKP